MNEKVISITTSVIKAVISGIPEIGGPLSNIIGDMSQERYNQRLEESIKEMCTILSSKIKTIDKNKISTDDFKDIFVNTLNDIMKNRTIEKRKALTNILINTITNYNIDFDESEYMTRIINNFSVKHLLILGELKDIVIPDYEEGFAVTVIDKIEKKHSLNSRNIIECVHDLENEYLVHALSSQYYAGKRNTKSGIHPGGIVETGVNNYLTNKGKKLLDVIKSY
jgi:methionine synthase II (cobalamin-independent)